MRKFVFLISLAVLVTVLSGSAAFSQNMDDVKAQLKAQVRREMGLSDAPVKAPGQASTAKQGVRQKKTFDLDFRNIDIETALQWVIIMMFMGFIPATIAHFKGHNFFLWWLLGVAFFIIALPVIIFLKKRQKRSSRKKDEVTAKEEAPAEEIPAATESQKEQKPPAKKPAKASALDIYDQIEKLSELKARGVLTQEEFREKKRELLDRI
jgi:hypothetical protein